jgi:myosin tail region-interacting protein MTI1
MSTAPFKVKAIYEYSSPHDDDLSFPQAQIITVTEEEDNDWYAGEFVDAAGKKHEGIFPRNFVEKYEPQIPSRPTRPARTKNAEASSTAPAPAVTQNLPTEPAAPSAERPVEISSPRLVTSASLPPTQPSSQQPSATAVGKSQEQPLAKPTSHSNPAQDNEKAGGGSFKDRIAAFNKTTAPPIAPFKPGGQSTSSSTGFIKKPFVAPPPSKNAYVPPPREAPPAKVYRREENPNINEAAEDSEASMPMLERKAADDIADNQPKPTSLKDRIAILQKQQLEQAARHADAAQKKEKPKRPPKKRA